MPAEAVEPRAYRQTVTVSRPAWRAGAGEMAEHGLIAELAKRVHADGRKFEDWPEVEVVFEHFVELEVGPAKARELRIQECAEQDAQLVTLRGSVVAVGR